MYVIIPLIYSHVVIFIYVFHVSKVCKTEKPIKTWSTQKAAKPYFHVGGIDAAFVSL